MEEKTKVGVIGLGMMGNTHLDIYAAHPGAEVVAVSDANPDLLSGKARAGGNIEGQAQGGFDLGAVERYPEGKDLIADPAVELVDICLPTFLHKEYALAAVEAGKHLLLEKPVARTAADAHLIAEAAERAGVVAMPAMCMRFWPGWDWLKDAVAAGTYGAVLSAHFTRACEQPAGAFYQDGARCGGGLLDLHIHDTDFVHHVFGMPAAVQSCGYSSVSGEVDHLVTQYRYAGAGGNPLVVAEGAWTRRYGQPFIMRYTVNFEGAAAIFDLATSGPSPLTLYREGEEPDPVELDARMGYYFEIDHFLARVAEGRPPEIVTLRDGARTIEICEAEKRSVETGAPVELEPS